MMRIPLFVVFAVVTLSGVNCVQGILDQIPGQQVCTTEFAYGVSADVTNATTGAAITGAILTLQDGAYVEVMQSFPTGDYVGAGERAGTYTLTALAAGFETKTIENVVVKAGTCHVTGVRVDVQLQPLQ